MLPTTKQRLGLALSLLPSAFLLYLVPRTRRLGMLLMIGFLGGAVASHVRLDDPLLSHSLFPIYIAALLWTGLALRDPITAPFLTLRR
jgi:DoxX-like protein